MSLKPGAEADFKKIPVLVADWYEKNKPGGSGGSSDKGDVKKDHIDGTLNGGGVPVTVHGGSSINFSLK